MHVLSPSIQGQQNEHPALKTAVMIALFFSSAVHAATLYKLGDNNTGTSETRATGINNANQVAGYSYTNDGSGLLTNHALLWLNDANNSVAEFAPLGGLTSINYARFNAISNAQQIVGTSNQTADTRNSPFGKQRATVWGVNGTPQQGGFQGLLAPSSNGSYAGFPEASIDLSDALAVNNAGAVVGYRTFKEGVDNNPHGAVWLYRNAKWNVYFVGAESTFNGISDAGLIVGWARSGGIYSGAPKKPWVWNNVGEGEQGQELACKTDGGTANAVNSAAIVVGSSYVDEGTGTNKTRNTSAVYWLGTAANCVQFPSLGGTYSEAKAIQKDGQAVGSANTPSGQKHAVLYYRQSPSVYAVIDLNSYTGNGASVGFSYLEEATGINDSGNIVGYGMLPNGKRAAFKIMGLFGTASAASVTTRSVTMSESEEAPEKTLSRGEEVSVQSSSASQMVQLNHVKPLKLSTEE
ncbi:MAG: hypothetical protein NT086_03605 [Proteobacteria bacterium]|nr:hypothetical protein [Pseudomonadota bacterium]